MSVNIFKNGILSKIAGAVGDAVPLINNFLTNQEGKGAADANTVYVLNNKIEELNSSLTDLANYLGYEFGSLIPKLSADSSSIITSGYNTNNNAYSYYAFDKDENTFYQSSTIGYDDHAYIGYDFGNKQQISKCKVVFINKDTVSDNVTIKIQGSNDNSNWTDISTFSTGTLASGATYKYTKEVSANYRYYRAYKVSSTAYSRLAIAEINFYK